MIEWEADGFEDVITSKPLRLVFVCFMQWLIRLSVRKSCDQTVSLADRIRRGWSVVINNTF